MEYGTINVITGIVQANWVGVIPLHLCLGGPGQKLIHLDDFGM